MLPLEKLITRVSPLSNIQHIFDTTNKNLVDIKYLLDMKYQKRPFQFGKILINYTL